MLQKPKILIVDDQQTNIMLLKAQLKEYQIIEADNGRTALKKVVDESPDLILLDVMMPGVDGYSVLSILKKSEESKLIPVILVSSLTSIDDKIKSLQIGADDFITKPFNPLELRARVKNLLRIKDLQDELAETYNTIISLALAHDAKHNYCCNHSKKTAFYAVKLAQKLIPVKSQLRQIKLAGLLHDIGKVKIPEGIFLKPDQLTTEEFEIVKTHPVVGEKICARVSKLKPILPFIRHHHEHYNGTGYPDNLQGDSIPYGARILAIADAFDALTSDRPYRKAYDSDEAIKILVENAGKQWDPHLVEVFCQLIKEDKSIAAEQILWELEED